jgi:cell division septation protein DedD
MKKFIIILICLSFFGTELFAQNKQIRDALKKITAGKTEDAKKDLARLNKENPNDAGVILLNGVLCDDAFKAVTFYEKIVKSYPQSEWADDAYWRIIQFYAIKGDIEKALSEFDTYRVKYPTSEFLQPAFDVIRSSALISKSANHPEDKTELVEAKETAKPKETVKAKNETKKTNEKPSWGLQVGVYSSEEAANKELDKFKKQRLRSEVIPKDVDDSKMYAVVIGNYSSKESAEKNKAIVEKICGCKPIVYKKGSK